MDVKWCFNASWGLKGLKEYHSYAVGTGPNIFVFKHIPEQINSIQIAKMFCGRWLVKLPFEHVEDIYFLRKYKKIVIWNCKLLLHLIDSGY